MNMWPGRNEHFSLATYPSHCINSYLDCVCECEKVRIYMYEVEGVNKSLCWSYNRPKGGTWLKTTRRLSHHMILVPHSAALTRWFYHPFPVSTSEIPLKSPQKESNYPPKPLSVVHLSKHPLFLDFTMRVQLVQNTSKMWKMAEPIGGFWSNSPRATDPLSCLIFSRSRQLCNSLQDTKKSFVKGYFTIRAQIWLQFQQDSAKFCVLTGCDNWCNICSGGGQIRYSLICKQ